MPERLLQLRALFDTFRIDALLVSTVANIIYLTGFEGLDLFDRNAYILITKHNAYIFTHGIYLEDIKNHVSGINVIQITREKPITEKLQELVQLHSISTLGFESHNLTVSEYQMLATVIDEKILKPVTPVETLRLTKDHQEIVNIKKACEISDKAFLYIKKKIHVGMSERNMAAELDYYIKTHGGQKLAFDTIVAVSQNASDPHHSPTDKKVTINSLILLDFGVSKGAYCSDMSRTLFLGKPTNDEKKAYQIVLTAQEKAEEFIEMKLSKHQSIKTRDVDLIAREYIISKGYNTMPHSLGHGIGIEVHEAPRLTPVSTEYLQNGCVFSIEPGIYIPKHFGIRIEDLYAIEDNTLIRLTKSTSAMLEI